jgi:hypothetical protein
MELTGEHLTPLDYALIGEKADTRDAIVDVLKQAGALTTTLIRDYAATAIQAVYRGHRIRKQAAAMKTELSAKQFNEQARAAPSNTQVTIGPTKCMRL